jgi:broad specificity phosphatase PhoE
MQLYKEIYFCRQAEKSRAQGDDCLTDQGVAQSQDLAETLLTSVGRTKKVACVVSSPSGRALQTARPICNAFGKTVIVDDSLRESVHFDALVAQRIKSAIERALQHEGDAYLLVTHSGVIFYVQKLAGAVPWGARFKPVDQGDFVKLRIPLSCSFEKNSNQHMQWRCETPREYRGCLDYVGAEVDYLDRRWNQHPPPLRKTSDWEIIEDEWKERKMEARHGEGTRALLAMARFEAASLRDVNFTHLDAFEELERLYPESQYLKYVQYPPFAWKLHVHIMLIRAGEELPEYLIPYHNVVFTRDILECLKSGRQSYAQRNMLLHHQDYKQK